MCKPPATALQARDDAPSPTKLSKTPTAKAHAVQTRKARGCGGDGFEQKTTIELSILSLVGTVRER
eukprot:3627262-Prymnesium_polylepis.1